MSSYYIHMLLFTCELVVFALVRAATCLNLVHYLNGYSVYDVILINVLLIWYLVQTCDPSVYCSYSSMLLGRSNRSIHCRIGIDFARPMCSDATVPVSPSRFNASYAVIHLFQRLYFFYNYSFVSSFCRVGIAFFLKF